MGPQQESTAASELQAMILIELFAPGSGTRDFVFGGKAVTPEALAKHLAELPKPTSLAFASDEVRFRIEAVALGDREVQADQLRVASFWSRDGIGACLRDGLGFSESDLIGVRAGAAHLHISLANFAEWWRDYQPPPGLILGLHEGDRTRGPDGAEVRISAGKVTPLKWLVRQRRSS